MHFTVSRATVRDTAYHTEIQASNGVFANYFREKTGEVSVGLIYDAMHYIRGCMKSFTLMVGFLLASQAQAASYKATYQAPGTFAEMTESGPSDKRILKSLAAVLPHWPTTEITLTLDNGSVYQLTARKTQDKSEQVTEDSKKTCQYTLSGSGATTAHSGMIKAKSTTDCVAAALKDLVDSQKLGAAQAWKSVGVENSEYYKFARKSYQRKLGGFEIEVK